MGRETDDMRRTFRLLGELLFSCRAILLTVCIAYQTGCSAITNPVANGIPARLLPAELLAESKEDLEPVPLDWLRRERPQVYRIDVGDILGVVIPNVLPPTDDVLPPIHFPQVENQPPSIGYPIPVGETGDVSLPLIDKVQVAGLTIDEAEERIIEVYRAKQQLDDARVLVTLVRARQARILVIREDSPNQRPQLNDPTFRLFGSAPSLADARSQGTGFVLELPQTEADVLSALAKSGGLPGPTARNEVIIYRGFDDAAGFEAPSEWLESDSGADQRNDRRAIRIPLRIVPGSPRPFDPQEVQLESGDIVFVPSRDTDVYYTGGLMQPREVPLPRDNDIRVVEAILRVGGPINNGGVLIGNFGGTSAFTRGLGHPSPSLLTVLRRTPGGRQVPIRVNLNRALRDPRENILVMPGDVLLLQETPAEAVARYISNVVNLSVFVELFDRGSAQGTGAVVLP